MANRIPVPALDLIDRLTKLIVVNDKEVKEAIEDYIKNFRDELHSVGYEASDVLEAQVAHLNNVLNQYFADEHSETIDNKKEDSKKDEEDDLEDYAPRTAVDTDVDDEELDDYLRG